MKRVIVILLIYSATTTALLMCKRKSKIKAEYLLEVTEDSIKIESLEGRVYEGRYIDLDSLINVDNL